MSGNPTLSNRSLPLAASLFALLLLSCGSDGRADRQAAGLTAGLPEQVLFRGNSESFNSRYWVCLREGDLWIRPNRERTGVDGAWQRLANLPEGLDGQVSELAVDDEHIIALNRDREIYTLWSALDEIEAFRWQKQWGLPFWFGPGMSLRPDLLKWDFSVVSPREDEFYTDPAGNLHPVGFAKCSHIIMLNPGGQTLTFNDPWLPCDYSYEIGTPCRGRFLAAASSSSGSTHFLINRFGDMFTRTFDFDLSGLDDLFVRYSYEDQRGVSAPVIQLPAEPWKKQPKIVTPGLAAITDRISIAKVGTHCVHRTLRVEGLDSQGRTGYYEKDLPEPDAAAWTFQVTGEGLRGRLLENRPEDCSAETLGESEDRPYAMPAGASPSHPDLTAEIPDFNGYNTPARLRLRLAGAGEIELVLHYLDTVRIFPRQRGLDDTPRRFAGAIEVPVDLLDRLPALPTAVRDFLHACLELDDGGRFTDVTLRVTLDELHIESRALAWTFRSSGGAGDSDRAIP